MYKILLILILSVVAESKLTFQEPSSPFYLTGDVINYRIKTSSDIMDATKLQIGLFKYIRVFPDRLSSSSPLVSSFELEKNNEVEGNIRLVDKLNSGTYQIKVFQYNRFGIKATIAKSRKFTVLHAGPVYGMEAMVKSFQIRDTSVHLEIDRSVNDLDKYFIELLDGSTGARLQTITGLSSHTFIFPLPTDVDTLYVEILRKRNVKTKLIFRSSRINIRNLIEGVDELKLFEDESEVEEESLPIQKCHVCDKEECRHDFESCPLDRWECVHCFTEYETVKEEEEKKAQLKTPKRSVAPLREKPRNAVEKATKYPKGSPPSSMQRASSVKGFFERLFSRTNDVKV